MKLIFQIMFLRGQCSRIDQR
ncbi:hypothetical protein F383_37638 [Gossypium arboreum]|uniref:Uncharacterized protein n=1 Tax=Gossypium arboreum TaxID=29729 RepID=A0A0B0MG16_GOSAR|nr:hypothetical protein F383_37638 [Gossypium arboreum]